MKLHGLALIFVSSIGLNAFINVSAAISENSIFFPSKQYGNGQKNPWNDLTENQKALYLERHKAEIDYCLNSAAKKAKDLDPAMQCCAGIGDAPISYFRIALKYANYGDPIKAAYYHHRDWLESIKDPNWRLSEDPLYGTIRGYEWAGMYKEALPFYQKAYKKLMERLKVGTDINLLEINFEKYKMNWPDEADDYISLKRDWDKAKELAKTAKPKPLDPAVQNHEWFYSDKQDEVLKALGYYSVNKVQFMLEKALKHKDPAVAAKAKEFLNKLVKTDKK